MNFGETFVPLPSELGNPGRLGIKALDLSPQIRQSNPTKLNPVQELSILGKPH